jgi:hypothetical protein
MPKLSVLIFVFLYQFSYSQFRIYSNEFLSIGVGADALAMSGSVIASSKGAFSGIRNPSCLVDQKTNFDLAAMHSEYFAGIAKYDFLSGSYRTADSSVIAISAIRFGIDDIPNTLELIDENGNVDYSRISYFSVADYAFFLSYAKKSKLTGLSYGANAKIIYRNMGNFAKAFGFGFDVAANYKLNNWIFGANFKDITTTFNAWFYNTEEYDSIFSATGNEIPTASIELTAPKLLTGIAYKLNFNQNYSLLSEMGLDFSFDGKKHVLLTSKLFSIDPHIGFELNYKDLVFLRTGVGNFALIPDFDKDKFSLQPNIGLGIHIFNVRIDYALTDIGNLSDALYSNVFSINFAFNSFVKNKKNITKSN